MKVYPKITVVDDSDTVIGCMQLPEALAKGLNRRISAVVIINEAGRILLQKRASGILSPNTFDFSAGGHVNEGDDYLSAAYTELSEELGIKDAVLELVTPPFRILDMFISVYKAFVLNDISIIVDPEEVSGVLWVSFEELNSMITSDPAQFAKPFIESWPYVRDKIIAT